MKEIDQKYLLDVADALDRAERVGVPGAKEDFKFIWISSIQADMIAGTLRAIAERN